jgi:hypothetical protein
MPRLQKVTEKVFAEIAETSQKKGSYTSFLEVDQVLGLPQSEELRELKLLYEEYTGKSKKMISKLASIEEIVIQIRCKNVVSKELRLSLSRNYIYARSIFYRRGNKINDIRIVVGTTEEYGDNLGELITTTAFRDLCILDITVAMEKEIETNINQLKTLIQNESIKSN